MLRLSRKKKEKNMKKLLTTLTLAVFTMAAQAQAPSFPGAEGHGRYTTGGRGGKVVHVTNLNDSGTGSFRQAVKGTDKKIVVFDVAGVIALQSDVNIGANTTILGQTAPAPGITLRYYNVNPSGNNIVMRFIRIRRGQEKDINDGADASTARHYTGMMLDHCSFSWSIDETASFYDNNNFTMQWCTVGESLVNPGHSKGAHGYGGIWGGKLASFHHNLLIHHSNRTPRFNGARYDWTGYTGNKLYSEYNWENAVQAENVDFRNCVIYNCGNGCYGGPGGGKINMVNNYYKTGPAATTSRLTTVTVGASGNASGYPIYWTMTSRYYLSGNQINSTANAGWSYMTYDDGTYVINGKRYSPDPNHYNGANETYVKNTSNTDCICIQLDEPGPMGTVTTHTAKKAYDKVLAYCGSSLTPDDVDTRYMTETKNGTATYSGSVTGKKGRIDLVSDVNGYTEANFGTGSRPEGFDTDQDGMPDAWETANGLNPNSATDAQLYTLDPKKYYTNVEVYANSLVQEIMLNGNADAESAVEEYYPAYTKEDGTKVEAINGGGDDPKPIEGVTGDINWSLSEGTATPAYAFSSAIGDYLAEPTMTLGSHMKVSGTKNAGTLTETTFTINDESTDASATEGNAIKFNITPKEGYRFQPSHVSFNITRFGTDRTKFQAYWLYDDGTRIEIAEEQQANRDNNADSKFTTIDENVSGKASTGTSSLVIHLYDVASNKVMGLANVSITGTVASNASAVQELSLPHASATVYYDLRGNRISKPQRGVNMRMERTADGKQKVSKVIVK